MSACEIIELVKGISKLPLNSIMNSRKPTNVRCKYVIVQLLREDIIAERGTCSEQTLANALNIKRDTIHHALVRIEEMLEFDKEYKSIYLACIAKLAEMEETE